MGGGSQAIFKASPAAAELEAFCATEAEVRQARKGVRDQMKQGHVDSR